MPSSTRVISSGVSRGGTLLAYIIWSMLCSSSPESRRRASRESSSPSLQFQLLSLMSRFISGRVLATTLAVALFAVRFPSQKARKQPKTIRTVKLAIPTNAISHSVESSFPPPKDCARLDDDNGTCGGVGGGGGDGTGVTRVVIVGGELRTMLTPRSELNRVMNEGSATLVTTLARSTVCATLSSPLTVTRSSPGTPVSMICRLFAVTPLGIPATSELMSDVRKAADVMSTD